MIRWLVSQFLRGCLVLFPIVGTVYAVWFVLSSIDWLVRSLVEIPSVPGVGLLLAVGVVTAVGAIASNVVGRAVVGWLDRLVVTVPLIGLLYSAIRDVVSAFVGEKRSFDRPAVVDLGDVRVFGFVTRESFDDPRLAGCVGVYLPQSYNFAGNLVVVPADRVQRLDLAGPEFMAFVVSGGISSGHSSSR